MRNAENRLHSLAHTDAITGMGNRHAFNERLAAEIERARALGRRVALVYIDLDNFKTLNDTFGHAAGDAALKHVAEVMRRARRRADLAARYGGEEFGAILPGADQQGALQLAERLRRALEKSHVVAEGARLSVTANFGLAVWPGDGADARALIAAADRALYAAKAAGRNRVVAAASLPPATP